VGLTRPTWLAPIERWWMAFAEVLGRVVTVIILTLTFFVVMTPIGWLKRVFSGDTLGLTSDPKIRTYWIEVDPDGPTSRPDRPF
jgi:hypothetical protein